jgi:SAM-dependent methyltransferase
MTDMGDRVSAESRAVIERYTRRRATYDPADPWVRAVQGELERAIAAWISGSLDGRPGHWRLLDVGCGNGSHLSRFLRLGFSPKNLSGIELIPERAAAARENLPSEIRIDCGDAVRCLESHEPVDIGFQSLVFSSILDDKVQEDLARNMWSVVRPGGGILWYDFIYDNPSNPDVRGVSLKRVRQLFPEGRPQWQRLTLAPPLGRWTARRVPALYPVLNAIPWLRTHILAWIPKVDAA